MPKYPKWATPLRRLALAQLALEFLDKPGWYIDLDSQEIYHPEYSKEAEALIEYWKEDDREARAYELKLIKREQNRLYERKPTRRMFDPEVFFNSQPVYYIEGLGVSADFKPVVKIRLASSRIVMFIDLSELSKNQLRKALRYGHLEPVRELINKAVRRRLGEIA